MKKEQTIMIKKSSKMIGLFNLILIINILYLNFINKGLYYIVNDVWGWR